MSDPNYPPPGNYGNEPPGTPPPGGQPPGGGYPSYPQGSGMPAGSDAKGFFGALFDFSFNSFVTPKIVKVVYILAVIALGLVYLGFVIVGFSQSAGLGLVYLIVGPIFIIIYLALIRMTLEFYYALVRMSEDIHDRLPHR